MTIELSLTTFLTALSVPSAITGFCFWLVQRRITKRDEADKKEREARQKAVDKQEEARQKNEYYTMKLLAACTTLSFATARAVQRIPDAHCNGDMDAALSYAEDIKHQLRDFLDAQAIDGMY
jgi:heme exporter protein D